MVKSRVKNKEPIMGSLNSPYRETGMSDFGHCLWWAFCYQNINKVISKKYERKRTCTAIRQKRGRNLS